MQPKKKPAGERPISFRASRQFEERIGAAAAALGLERSEFIRFCIVRGITRVGAIARARASSTDEPSQLLIEAKRLESIVPSPEEIIGSLRSDFEMPQPSKALEDRVAKLEELAAGLAKSGKPSRDR